MQRISLKAPISAQKVISGKCVTASMSISLGNEEGFHFMQRIGLKAPIFKNVLISLRNEQGFYFMQAIS